MTKQFSLRSWIYDFETMLDHNEPTFPSRLWPNVTKPDRLRSRLECTEILEFEKLCKLYGVTFNHKVGIALSNMDALPTRAFIVGWATYSCGMVYRLRMTSEISFEQFAVLIAKCRTITWHQMNTLWRRQNELGRFDRLTELTINDFLKL